MNRSKLLVLVIITVSIGVVGMLYFYVHQHGSQKLLADVQCRSLLSTSFELQGKPVLMGEEETCRMMATIAAMTPLDKDAASDPSDPWHYYGRLRIRPVDDVWFLVFLARKSDNYKPRFSLRHRRGAGWTIMGIFDAEPILRQLGVHDKIDMEQLRSPASLTPVDETTAM